MSVIVTGAILLFLLFMITSIGKKINCKEPFTQLTKNVNVLLDFPVQKNITVKDVNYGDLNQYVYKTPMASYKQVTNNKRDWSNPENGSALFPPINGTTLYA